MSEFLILQYTDAHGRYLSHLPQDQAIRLKGLDRLSTYLRPVRASRTEYLLIDNGDSIQGQPLVDLWQPPPIDDPRLDHPLNLLHRALGVHAFVLGNHEFNFGLQRLQEIQAHSQVQWLGANILQEGQLVYDAYGIFEREGVKIGVLGLITEFVPKWEPTQALKSLTFANVIQTARHWIPKIREECDLLVVSYHGGLNTNPVTGEKLGALSLENQGCELWEEFPQIDILLTGHQHRQILTDPADKALLAQASCQGRCWAEVWVTPRPLIQVAGQIVQAQDYDPDPALAELLLPNLKRNESYLSQVLGYAEPNFQISDPMTEVWIQKHALIQWINDLMLQATGADIAASSLLDAEVKGLPSKVTMQDVLTTYFFQDSLCVLKITGEILQQALEQAASFFSCPRGATSLADLSVNPAWGDSRVKSYNYDFFEGIRYSFNLSKPVGQRVTELFFQEKEVKKEDSFRLALTTYRAGGGFYEMYGPHLIVEELSVKITDLMAEDLKAKGTLHIQPIQNFQLLFS